MKKVISIFCFLTVLSMVLCRWHESYYYLFFDNRTGDTLGVFMGTGFFEGVPVVYPDTLLPKDTIAYKGFLFSECLGAYPPHERTSYMSIVNEEWDEFLRKTLPRDTMSIFVINNDTLRKYGYEMVREKNMIVVRYELSTSNIRELDYTIPYPPSPQMKDMRMSPKYESLLKN